MSIDPNPIARLDRPRVELEAELHLRDLLAHPVPESAPLKARHDWYAEIFRDLAKVHPDLCTQSADPVWEAWLAAQIEKSNQTRKTTPEGAS